MTPKPERTHIAGSLDRRRFLKTAAAAAGLALSPRSLLSAGSPRKKVLVLGAGLAGLAAAYELQEAGHEVTVLEARTRAGGRVFTLREGFSDGLSAEAGAIAFSDSYRHLLRFARLLKVSYESPQVPAIRSARADALYHLRGKRVRARADGSVDWPYELTAEERALGRTGILRKYVLAVLEGVSDPAEPYALPDWVRPYDRMTLTELAAQRGASPGARELLRRTFWFADAKEAESAASSMLADLALFYRGQVAYAFSGGNDALPRAFASRLRERIRYGAEVVRIGQGSEHVEVVVRQAGVPERLAADRVVCALPFSVLRGIEVDPPFSPQKREVVKKLEYQPVTRVFLQVRRRFWEDEGESGAAYTDLPVGQVQQHPILPTGSEGSRGILEAHARGAKARPLDAMAEDERVRFVLRHMEAVHPVVGRHFEGGLSKSWENDTWARGAYSLFRPGQVTEWLPVIVRPEGRVHFAGEHTSVLPATMEGALESGVRAAREVEGAA